MNTNPTMPLNTPAAPTAPAVAPAASPPAPAPPPAPAAAPAPVAAAAFALSVWPSDSESENAFGPEPRGTNSVLRHVHLALQVEGRRRGESTVVPAGATLLVEEVPQKVASALLPQTVQCIIVYVYNKLWAPPLPALAGVYEIEKGEKGPFRIQTTQPWLLEDLRAIGIQSVVDWTRWWDVFTNVGSKQPGGTGNGGDGNSHT